MFQSAAELFRSFFIYLKLELLTQISALEKIGILQDELFHQLMILHTLLSDILIYFDPTSRLQGLHCLQNVHII